MATTPSTRRKVRPPAATAATAAPPAARPARQRRRAAPPTATPIDDAAALTQQVLALLTEPVALLVAVAARPAELAAPAAAPTAAPAPAVTPELKPAPKPAPAAADPPTAPDAPDHSALRWLAGSAQRIAWQPGRACPPALRAAAAALVDAQQHLPPGQDAALPLLLRLAQEAGHRLDVDPAIWPHLAAHRDARSRLALLEAAYPAGPASPALVNVLRAPLPAFQAEGALFAAVAGRALLADERGLGKSVTALAAATLLQRHVGVQRVALVCAADDVAAWLRAWQRFAPPAAGQPPVQAVSGGLHQRQALWSQPASVRILSPDALTSDAAHLRHWAPGLIIVDEPQGLGLRPADWAGLDAPYALVLCGAPLAEQPALMQALVAWLDPQGLGPLAALEELQAAADQGLALAEADVERLSASLSRLMLQRARSDVAPQLPPVVHSERLLPLAPAQRDAHDSALALARQLLAGWQHSGYLADADQWRLVQALQAMQQAALRQQPGQPDSPLADPVLHALAAQRAAWCGTAPAGGDEAGASLQVALLCPSAADRAQLAAWLAAQEEGSAAPAGAPQWHLVGPSDPLPDGLDAVLHLGVAWRPRRTALGGRAPAGQQWVSLVGQGSLDAGLFDTLAQRADLPRSLLDGGRGFLQGERLQQWLQAVQAALAGVDSGA